MVFVVWLMPFYHLTGIKALKKYWRLYGLSSILNRNYKIVALTITYVYKIISWTI